MAFELLELRELLSAAPIISEFLASNKTGLQDSFGDYSDWIELFNPDSQQAVDLTGWKLRHKSTNWTFPAVTLGPGESRIVFATDRNLTDPNGELHTNFNLDKDGGNLKLLDTAGDVVYEYAPFPVQQADISYGVGQIVDETKLLSAGDAVRYLVPANGALGAAWKDLGFNDSGWAPAAQGLGYAELVPGFAVRGFKAGSVSSVTTLAAAQAVIDNPANQNWTLNETVPTVNYLNTGGAGHFLYDRTYPGATIGIAQSNFVVEAVGQVHVSTAGLWTFGVNSDDGFRLSIGGAAFSSVSGTGTTIVGGAMQFDGTRTVADSLGMVTFAAPGDYDVKLLCYQSTGTAAVELFAAQGGYTSWGATPNWRLVGDTAAGGLAVVGAPFTGAANSVAGLVETDVRTKVQQTGNNALYARMAFDAADWQSLATLTLKIAYDDGYVAYLNGAEIARRNVPATVAWNSRAVAARTSEVQSSSYETVDITSFLDPANPNHLLATGNVLAIQVLGASGNDGDLLVSAEIAQIASTSLGTHFFTTPTPGGANAQQYWQAAESPEFSVAHGFRDQAFDLAISSRTAGASICYTLDGSDPLVPYVPRIVASIARSGTTATVTSTGHGYANGTLVQISGAAQAEYNGVFVISGATANTFSYAVPATAATMASGNIVAVKVDRAATAIVRSGTTATATSAAHGYAVGDVVRIAGATQSEYNGNVTITAVTTDTFSFAVSGTPATPATTGSRIGVTKLGRQYAAPLRIAGTTVVRAVAVKNGCEPSPSVTSTYVFIADVIGQPALPGGFPAMWSTWPADYQMDPRITTDPANAGVLADALRSLPSMSLVTNKDNLFDAEYGMYANTVTSLNENYNGLPLRTPVSLEYFDPNGGEDFQINAGANIYGGWGRKPEYKKHSFRFVFQSEYGPTKLQTSFLGDGAVEEFDTLILRAQFNDSWPAGGSITQYIRDTFATDSHLAMGEPDHHSRWVNLYIDGLYWGIYQATERPDDSFAAAYMGGDSDDWEANNAGYSDGSTAGLPAWNDLMAKTNWGQSVTTYQAGAPGFNATCYTAAGSTTPGFQSIYYKANVTVGNLATAESVINTPSMQTAVSQHDVATVNYLNNGTDGRFAAGNSGFPGAGTTATNDFAVEITSSLTIAATGWWTFGVSGDDGFRLTLTNGADTYTCSNDIQASGPTDRIQPLNILTAGNYRLRLVYFQRSGGAELELFAAQGYYSSWDSTTAWKLIGDPALTGLTTYKVLALASLADAESIVATPAKQAWSLSHVVSTVNYFNTGADGRYTAGNVAFPGTAINTAAQSFAVKLESTIFIPTTGQWTLGVSSDDGFHLELYDGATRVLDSYYNGARTAADTFATVDFTKAGPYTLRLVYYQSTTAGAELELFAAKGSFISWAATTTWQLVGGNVTAGTNPGLLALASVTPIASLAAAENVIAQPTLTATGIVRVGTVATVTLPGHGFVNGDIVYVSSAGQSQYNGTFAVSNVTANTFSYTVPGAPATPATGTILVRKSVQAWKSTSSPVNVIDYLSTGADGHFTTNNLFPGLGGAGAGAAVQNLVLEATTTVSIPTAGQWTFGVHSDEGFRLTLTNGADTFTAQYDGLRTPGDTLTTFNITRPGAYRMRLVYFQNTAGAEVELSAAPGAWTAWSQTNAWRLVGDQAKGGLGTSLYDFLAATVYRANVPVTTLAAARDVVNDPAKQTAVNTEYRQTVNFLNIGGEGHFADSTAFPGMATDGVQTEIDDFVVAVRASVNLTAAGQWTFGVLCDDGFSLKLYDGVTLLGEFQYDGLRGTTDALRIFNVPRAGVYTLELVYFQHAGEAGLELYAAQGTQSVFSPGVFRLVGDTSQGGLAIGSGVDNTAMFFALMGMNPDGTRNPEYPVLLDMHNYIDYMLVNIYLGMGDWPGHNFYSARPSGPDSTGYKFFGWDGEFSIGYGSSTPTANVTGVNVMAARPYYYLAGVPEFRLMFADHVYKQLCNDGPLTAAAAQERYRTIAATVEWGIILESARWGDVNQGTPDTPDMWRNQRDWALNTYFPQRTAVVVQQLRDAALYPGIDPPAFAVNGVGHYGGVFRPGDTLTLSAASGTIYYTTDGSDPRLIGGALNPAALGYTSSIALTQGVQIKARAYFAGEWSALADAGFYPDLAPSLRITEVMYNPAAPSAAETAAGFTDNNRFEYVELTNIGGQTLPLSGLRLGKGIDFTFSNVTIAPGQFALVVADATAFRFRYGDAMLARFGNGWESQLVAGEYTGRLDNAGENLQLDAPVGGVIQEFTYGDGWYGHTDGEGFSLTVRDPAQDRPLWDRSDGWRSSAAPGGTPGYGDTLEAPGSVVVNEVLSHSSTAEGDMIEFHNTTDHSIDVGGWFVSDGASDLVRYRIAAGTIIAAHDYLVLVESRDFGSAADPGCRTPFALSEHGDDVYLSSNADGVAGGYREHVDFGGAPNGVSTGLHVRSTGGTDFTLLETPTFGSAPDYRGGPNSIPYISPLVFSEIMYHPAAPTAAEIAAGFPDADDFEYLELYNRSETAQTLGNFHVGDGVAFTFGWYPDGTDAEVWTLESGATATWTAAGLQNGAYAVYAHYTLVDGDGKRRKLDDAAPYTITSAGGQTTVTIDQNQPGLSGGDVWVELGSYAFSGSGTVQLARGATAPDNWTIADAVKFVKVGHEVVVGQPTLDSFAIRNAATSVAPGGYVVLVRNCAAFDARYGIAAHDIPVAGVYSGSLDNGGEMLRLYVAGNPDPGVIPRYDIDRVNYGDRGSWPGRPDGDGPALMRVHPAAYGNDTVNWRATSVGGTPGAANVPLDKFPPSVPANLAGTAAAVPAVRIQLTWTASLEPESSVDHYVVYRNGSLLGSPASASYTDYDVATAVPYVYTVTAVNRDGYESAPSAAVAVSVPGAIGCSVPNVTHIEVNFSEPLDPATAANLARYVFSGGALAAVTLTANNTRAILTTAAPMTLNAAYTLTMNGLTTASGSQLPASIPLAVTYTPQGAGCILREYWSGIGGGAVTDLTNNANYPNNPSGRDYLTSFEAPVNWADTYGTRIRGYVVPPVTGGYTFWIASDDNGELWLSSDENPANKAKIAYVGSWTGSRAWTTFTTQYNATPIYLVAGQRYYIEALQKEGGGGDNLAVRWQLPGGLWENNDSTLPIPGVRLSPYGSSGDLTPPSAPGNLRATLGAGNTQVSLAWDAAVDADGTVSQYVVYRDGTAYGYSATTSFIDAAVSPAVRHSYQVAARNAGGLEGWRSTALAVAPVGIAAAVASAPTTVQLSFTEPLDRAAAEQAGSYALRAGKAVYALGAGMAVSGITFSGTMATATLSSHGFVNGQTVLIGGATPAQYNGSFTIYNVQQNTFSYTMTGTPGSSASGTIVAQPYGISRNGATAIVWSPNQGLSVGMQVLIAGADQPQYNGTFAVTAATATTFQYAVGGAPASPATGAAMVAIRADAPTQTPAAARLDGDGLTVTLTTPTMPFGSGWLVAVGGVRNRDGDLLPAGVQQPYTYGGGILREYWLGVGSGTAVSDLTASANYPNGTTGREIRAQFESVANQFTNSGERMRGYIVPAVTGAYCFYIASDDNSELWFSINDNPAAKTLIASVTGTTNAREWTKYASQKSVLIPLVAGQRYYIEALQKQGAGNGNLAVAWQRNGTAFDGLPISGAYLAPAAPFVDVLPLALALPRQGTADSSPPIAGTVSTSAGTVTVRVGGVYYAAVNTGIATWSLPNDAVGPLADGTYQVSACVTDAYGRLGFDATVDDLIIDTVAPAAMVLSPSPNPRRTPVSELQFVFSEPIGGFDLGDLRLTRDGGSDLLTGAETLTTTDNRVWTLGNLSGATAAPGAYVLTLPAAGAEIVDAGGNALTAATSTGWVMRPVGRVAGRYVFYNRSGFDGGDAAAGAADDAAIASDKWALLPGQTAAFANFTSYTRGINGIMVDIAGAADPAAITASDFAFKVGNDDAPGSWTPAPRPTSVAVRIGAGAGGSDRVTIIWADNAIQNQWLQVTVKADAITGLVTDDAFYFGNAIGDSGAGNAADFALVNAADELAVRAHRTGFAPTSLTNVYDFDRDRRVGASDELTARYLATAPEAALRLIDAPEQPAVFAVAAADWTDADLILTLGSDGNLHVFRAGTTIDVVVPCDPAGVAGVSVVARGQSDTLIDDFAGAYGTLLIRQVTFKTNGDDALSAATAITVDGGTLDLGGTSNTVESLTLFNGRVVNGTLNASSYTIYSGTIAATLGPGPIVKRTTGPATVTAPIHATTVDVQAGQLTAASIVADTLVIGAGGSVVIAPSVTEGSTTLLAAAAATPAEAPVGSVPAVSDATPERVAAVRAAAQATPVVESPDLERLTLLLAMERSATELSTRRHLQAIDAALAEGVSFFADLPSAFVPARPMRRRVGPPCLLL